MRVGAAGIGRLGDLCSASKGEWVGLWNSYTLDLRRGVFWFCGNFCPITVMRIYSI